jgi:hypothetical protein
MGSAERLMKGKIIREMAVLNFTCESNQHGSTIHYCISLREKCVNMITTAYHSADMPGCIKNSENVMVKKYFHVTTSHLCHIKF